MDEFIKIEFEAADVFKMNTDEKLNVLIKLGFANHAQLNKQASTLYGNGQPGICEVVRTQSSRLNWLWAAFTAGAGALGAVIITHVFK